MASEAVKILIEAEDLASSKVAQVAAKIDQNVKKIKDVGGKAKASTEFIGQLAGQLGGSEIAGFAGQLGGLTEKISQFSEVSKLGGAGALAFKAGLVGVVGVLSFNVGKAIGDAVFETERWNKALADAITMQDRLNAKLRDFAAARMKSQAAEVSAIEDPARQFEAIEKVNKAYDDQALSIGKTIAEMEKQKSKIDDFDEFVLGGFVKTASEFEREEIDRNITAQKEMLQTIRDQQIEFKKNVEEQRKARIEAEQKAELERDQSVLRNLEQELSLLKANEEEARKLKAEYAGLKGVAAERAVELMRQSDEEKKRQEQERKAFDDETKRVEKEQSDRMRLAELVGSETRQLELRRVELEKGAEAAKALSLQMRGVPEAIAKQIAAEDVLLKTLERNKQVEQDVNKQMLQPQQAFQSRFLRSGPMNNPNEKLEKEAEKQTKIAEDSKAALEAIKEQTKPKVNIRDVRLEVVG